PCPQARPSMRSGPDWPGTSAGAPGTRASTARSEKREEPDENRRGAAGTPRAAFGEGSAADAPRRGPADAAGRLHGRLREPELRDPASEEVSQPLGLGRASEDRDAGSRALDRGARDVHGDHRLAAGAPAAPDPGGGGPRDRRSPDPEPRDARR